MTLTVDYDWQANGKPETLEFGMLWIQSGDEEDVADVIAVAEDLATAKQSEYGGCRMRRWGRRSWRVWEPGEGGFDMWIRVRVREDDE